MNMKKELAAILLVFAMLFSLTACGKPAGTDKPADSSQTAGDSAAPSDSQEVYKIIIGGTSTEDHPTTQSDYKFKEICEERSGGRLVVEVYPNNTLGDSRAMLEAIQANEVQMSDPSAAVFSSFTEEFNFIGLPFLFNNRFAAYDFFDGEMGGRISEKVREDTGIRILGYFENGMRQLTNSKRPVTSPDDMKGLKIRVMESPMYIEMFTEMGASPTPMSFAELYTALQQGTVDGQDNSYTITCTNALYEVQSYMTELGHNFDVTPLCISDEFYMSLPEDLRQIVDEAAAEATAFDRQMCQDMEATYIETIQNGGCEIVKLTDEQRTAFRAVTEGCKDFFLKQYSPSIPLDEILAAVDTANAGA